MMAANTAKVAELLGAKVVGQVPDTGGGAFGAARLAENLRLAARASTSERKISPMQLAAQLLEEAVANLPDE